MANQIVGNEISSAEKPFEEQGPCLKQQALKFSSILKENIRLELVFYVKMHLEVVQEL